VIVNQWERRRRTDGITRVLVPTESTMEFMLAYLAKQQSPTALASAVGGETQNEGQAAHAPILRGACIHPSFA
jgi:hypothetical protein